MPHITIQMYPGRDDETKMKLAKAVLKNADKALYHSKETCKGTCTIWSDIKDKVQK